MIAALQRCGGVDFDGGGTSFRIWLVLMVAMALLVWMDWERNDATATVVEEAATVVEEETNNSSEEGEGE